MNKGEKMKKSLVFALIIYILLMVSSCCLLPDNSFVLVNADEKECYVGDTVLFNAVVHSDTPIQDE